MSDKIISVCYMIFMTCILAGLVYIAAFCLSQLSMLILAPEYCQQWFLGIFQYCIVGGGI